MITQTQKLENTLRKAVVQALQANVSEEHATAFFRKSSNNTPLFKEADAPSARNPPVPLAQEWEDSVGPFSSFPYCNPAIFVFLDKDFLSVILSSSSSSSKTLPHNRTTA